MTKLPTDLYPTTQVVTGKITPEEHARSMAEWLYNDLVCGYRLEIDQVYDLLKYHESVIKSCRK